MSSSSNPDLIKITEIFLIPSSFLVAALGTADTNVHRAGVSALGLVISGLWWFCGHEAFLEQYSPSPDRSEANVSRRIQLLLWMPACFICGWGISLVGHLLYWNQPLGHYWK